MQRARVLRGDAVSPRPDHPREVIPEVDLECVGGPLDGQRRTLHNLLPAYLRGHLAGYVADDEPAASDEGCYVVTEHLVLEWVPRDPEG